MKKKFLSLMMAAAVVATTSVSAFADTKEYEIEPETEKNVPITITGDIQNQKGEVLQSNITITVPTKTTFTVSPQGVLTAPTIEVRSKSDDEVSVIAKEFRDITPGTGERITVVPESEITRENQNVPRENVSLKLEGNRGIVSFKSEAQGSGVYNEQGTAQASDKVIGVVSNTEDLDLKLTGLAGKKATDASADNSADGAPVEAVRDTFTLILKFKRTK